MNHPENSQPGKNKHIFGNISFDHEPIILAPMEDVTDPPFRYICREMGADWVFTEFVSSDGLIRHAKKSKVKLDIYSGERPVSVQIFGADIDSMTEAARMVENVQPDFIDINFGCPVRKVATKGAGAGMLQTIPKMISMTREVVNAVKIPVTVKTRLGWDERSKPIVELAERLQDTGIAALTIHGRTRNQLYKGIADWRLIGEVKNNPAMKIPVIGNGDIKDGASARKAIDRFGVDGLMIGRASIGNPWIFREIKAYLSHNKDIPKPTLKERSEICKLHLIKSIEWKGEKRALLEMRRHYCTYFKGVRNFKPYRLKLVTSSDVQQVFDLIDQAGSLEDHIL
jgi:nifR3 family TIM-barrel protein